MSEQSTSGDPIAAFGPNEWLVDELYQRYLTDKHSVDQAWWEFFKDYGSDGGRAGNGSTPALPPVSTGAAEQTNGTAPAGAPAAPVKAEPAAPVAQARARQGCAARQGRAQAGGQGRAQGRGRGQGRARAEAGAQGCGRGQGRAQAA